MAKARINIASSNIDQINQICNDITDIAKSTKTKMSGPTPLPTQILKHTTRKSPCGDGKASWDKFEMRIHKRLIDIVEPTPKTVDSLMRLDLPAGVEVEIKL